VYLALALLAMHAPTAFVDEPVHYGQIDLFDHGDFRLFRPFLTMLPGYHVLVSALLWATDWRSLAGARFVSALFGLCTIGAFHLARRRAWTGENAATAALATLQFALLPILLPYDFLVYTDVLSLGLVLAATAATLSGRHVLSAALMIASMTVRQTNVIWLPLLAGMTLWAQRQQGTAGWRRQFGCVWPYLVGVALFAGYWLWNGSISLSKEQTAMHPDWSLHPGNIHFALFLCGLLLPLHVAGGCRTFASTLRSKPWLLLLPVTAFAVIWLTFRVDHPFNQLVDPLTLHNFVLQQCRDNAWCKAAYCLVAVAALCGLASTHLRPRAALLLYPCAILALAGFWVVEQRYALIPIALWLVFRERRSEAVETATMALWAVAAVCVCLGTFAGQFFP
jgi:alpha-1,2-glucosyltransferase